MYLTVEWSILFHKWPNFMMYGQQKQSSFGSFHSFENGSMAGKALDVFCAKGTKRKGTKRKVYMTLCDTVELTQFSGPGGQHALHSK